MSRDPHTIFHVHTVAAHTRITRNETYRLIGANPHERQRIPRIITATVSDNNTRLVCVIGLDRDCELSRGWHELVAGFIQRGTSPSHILEYIILHALFWPRRR